MHGRVAQAAPIRLKPLPVKLGQAEPYDYDYTRTGVVDLFMGCEPIRGQHHIFVIDQRRRVE